MQFDDGTIRSLNVRALELNLISQIDQRIDSHESQVTVSKHTIIKLIGNYSGCLSTTKMIYKSK